jgi:uncharacterized protein YndB with AHSA1/START domain
MARQFEVRWEGLLPASPQDVWDAVTCHADGYLWRIDYEPWVGGAERGLTPGGGTVTAWELSERLDAVLTVVHLLSSTGHTAPAGDALVRVDLADRALDLARMLSALLPGEPEVAGLLALVLVHHARQQTRTHHDGRVARLEDQDRGAWDRDAIAEADRLVVSALSAPGPSAPGRFALQAAIAALHAQAPSYAETKADLLGRLGRHDEAAQA